MHRDDFLFMPRVEKIRQSFEHEPFIFDQNQLRREPVALCEKLCAYLGVEAPALEASLPTLNEGVGEQRGERLRRMNGLGFFQWARGSAMARRLHLDPFELSGLLPGSDRPIRMEGDLATQLEKLYSADWEAVSALCCAALPAD